MNIEKYNDKNACKLLKIRIEEGWVVVDGKTNFQGGGKVSENEICWNTLSKCIFKSNNGRESDKTLLKIISASQSLIDKYQMNNVPVFVSKEEQEIENCFVHLYGYGNAISKEHEKKSFIAGYKANQNKFRESDLRKAINLMQYIHLFTNDVSELLDNLSGIIPSSKFDTLTTYILQKNTDGIDVILNDFYIDGYSITNQISLLCIDYT